MALIIVATIAIIGNALPSPARKLNGAGTFPIFIRLGEETYSIEVPSDGTIGDIYLTASTQLEGAQFSLHYGGQTLYDYTVPIADTGICAECVVEAILFTNDLQILDKMFKNDRCQEAWRHYTKERFGSYQEIERIACESTDCDVMAVVGQLYTYRGHAQIAHGRIRNLWLIMMFVDLDELWRLKGLTALTRLEFYDPRIEKYQIYQSNMVNIDLSGLMYLNELTCFQIENIQHLEELRFPNFTFGQSKLEEIEIANCPNLQRVDLRSLSGRGDNLTSKVDSEMDTEKVLVYERKEDKRLNFVIEINQYAYM